MNINGLHALTLQKFHRKEVSSWKPARYMGFHRRGDADYYLDMISRHPGDDKSVNICLWHKML